jgi:hypothetical protein
MVARDRLPDAEAGGQTATPGGPTAPRSHATMQLCVPLAAVVVKAIILVPLSTCADLYALLQCAEDFEYGRKAYGGYIEVFWALVAEDGESSLPATENFQSTNA